MDTITQKVDPRIEKLPFEDYDLTLLGGDMAEETSKFDWAMDYMTNIFHLEKPTTHWALGNHDNADMDLVKKHTNRHHFYTAHHNGITFLVLYTQEEIDWKCHIAEPQLSMIQAVTDTIQNSSHLIVMAHKLLWIRNNPELKHHQGTHEYNWSCNYWVTASNWNKDVKPLLQKVQQRGIQVLCIGGDIGNNIKEMEDKTSDGIVYLGSGIHAHDKKSKILLFDHNLKTKELNWHFKLLDEM